MRTILLLGIVTCGLPSLCAAQDATLGGATGLFTVPTADVQANGTVSAGVSRYNQRPDAFSSVDDYSLLVGFLPRLEVSGRISDAKSGARDLSFNAKYQLWGSNGGPAIAAGMQDVGGEARLFRSKYAVATLPWRSLRFSLGYGIGPDVFDGVLGGAEWRPFPFLGLIGEYDARDWNGAVRLVSPPFLGGARLSALAGYRGASARTEYGAQLSFPLGRSFAVSHRDWKADGAPEPASVDDGGAAAAGTAEPAPEAPVAAEEAPVAAEAPLDAAPVAPAPPRPVAAAAVPAANPALRRALEQLGFETVRIGVRDPDVQVVVLENRRYNLSTADGIGVALGAIAAHADPRIARIELTTTVYGVPQAAVEAPAALYRRYLADASLGSELAPVLHARLAAVVDEDGVRWDGAPASRLSTPELVLEPVLHTFVATEYGVLDYGLSARGRITQPLGQGLVLNVGVTSPPLESNDFHDGQNFAAFAPKAGVDTAVLQLFFRPAPQWTWMWTLGQTQVLRTNLVSLALEQAWVLGDGSNRVRFKLAGMANSAYTYEVALLGYTWFDATRDYSLGLTAGRFFLGEGGVRLDFDRYFGDTIVGAFFKYASPDDQAAGMSVSLPLTPRQDTYPRTLQLKGSRRWEYRLATTVNAVDHRNPLRPLLLYEPTWDLDLQRDILDSGRLGSAYLQDQLPRMREAYETYH